MGVLAYAWFGCTVCAAWAVWAVVEVQRGVSVREATLWPVYGPLRWVRRARKRRAEHAVGVQRASPDRRENGRPRV